MSCAPIRSPHCPTAPAVIRAATTKVRMIKKPLSIGACGSRGGRCMTSGSFASNASGRASATAATRLMHSNITRASGASRPSSVISKAASPVSFSPVSWRMTCAG